MATSPRSDDNNGKIQERVLKMDAALTIQSFVRARQAYIAVDRYSIMDPLFLMIIDIFCTYVYLAGLYGSIKRTDFVTPSRCNFYISKHNHHYNLLLSYSAIFVSYISSEFYFLYVRLCVGIGFRPLCRNLFN
jgi:hypothetical protein